ncbi:MAG: DUF3082 domain-containing protein [Gomphosphaeria aponina SAG 52.96 = DSM 107014]|uniref:DUF3082 domain-containing protein n=1 Tax=Gomphosphaeria aponina SAG 52.96 = DSM 107014 TaxID=1521640 RepID=A0A941GR92_9CHRO|nr:DUF3082 domain-containing protein [Gomphosphaeria aponina SAG 52.96 = DSM 107014]
MSEPESVELKGKKITPLRCLVGASISGALGSGLYLLTAAIAQTYAAKPITSTNPIVLNISVAVRTLVVGIVALGTFVFLFVAIGLILLAIQVIIQSFKQRDTSSADK